MTIAYSQFPTIVLYFTSIDPLTRTFTHSSDAFHEQQNIGGLLVEPVEASIDFVSQYSEIQTDVVLGCGLPLDIVISTLIANISVSKVVATVTSCDVVRRTSLSTAPKTC